MNQDKKEIENNVKVWNRFAHRDLKDMEGFKKCLAHTLFRPRDLLVLLNQAYILASRTGRKEIVGEDIGITSKQISYDRLQDLIKEYEKVFPGLPLFIRIFHGMAAVNKYNDVIEAINKQMSNNRFEDPNAKDFAILGSAQQVFYALYSVGFIGLQNISTGNYIFCHDGSRSDLSEIDDTRNTCIHPCYWNALEIGPEELSETALNDIYDEYQIQANPEVKDLRTQMMGQLIADLPQMPLGEDGAGKFEEWVFRTIKILFAGILTNPEMKPNGAAVQRRDIVATNMAGSGFWRRIFEDYGCRQVIFEIKNFQSLKAENFRQALSYTTEEYGRFAIIVNRSDQEGLSETERNWVKEMWNGHKRLIFILPAMLLTRFIRKLRNIDRYDYIETHLNRRLDTFIRSYLSLQAISTAKGKRREKESAA